MAQQTAVTPSAQDAAEGSDVSVVVCAYTLDRWEQLTAALASLRDQTLSPLEVILVIDHNRALLDRARRELPADLVIENGGPRGLSGARNSGIAAARGSVVAFLDDDAAAEPGWLATVVSAYQGPAVLGVGGSSVPAWASGRPRWFPVEFDWVVGCTYRGMPLHRAAVRNVIGSNMSIRRHVFDAVGGFRSDIGRVGSSPVGCEETELCIRARRELGGSIIYEPAAGVRHHVPAARATWRYYLSRCWAEGRSKALVSRITGPSDGLSSERTYVRRTLPAGVARGFSDAVRGDAWGLARAAAIAAGLLVTGTGFVTARLASLTIAGGEGGPSVATGPRPE